MMYIRRIRLPRYSKCIPRSDFGSRSESNRTRKIQYIYEGILLDQKRRKQYSAWRHFQFWESKFNFSVMYVFRMTVAVENIQHVKCILLQVFWKDCSKSVSTSLTLCHESPDGEGGFPGKIRASVRYTLNAENELRIQFEARADKPTPINMANHAYFNLAGHVSNLI